MQDVQKLTKAMVSRYAEREQQAQQDKARYARQQAIADSPQYTDMDFYCHKHGDFRCRAGKVVAGNGTMAYYVPLGGFKALFYSDNRLARACKAKRRITDKHFDPYYRHSKMIRRQQIEFADDFLQPGDPRFKAKYGDPYKKYYEEQEQLERKQWAKHKYGKL